MTVSGVGGTTRTFIYRGCNFTLGQVFRGLRVFTMPSSASFFVRTDQGHLGKLVGRGVDASLIGKKVDVSLVDYEIRGIGVNEKLFLTFELLEPEPVQAQPPPIIAPPEEKPKIEPNSDVELLVRGKTLGRDILKYGLNEERKQQAGKWLKLAFDAVEEFAAEVKIGWTKELYGEFGLYRNIAEQYPKRHRKV